MRIGGEVTSSGSGLAVMQVKIRRGCSFGVPLMTLPDVNLDPAVGNAAEHIPRGTHWSFLERLRTGIFYPRAGGLRPCKSGFRCKPVEIPQESRHHGEAGDHRSATGLAHDEMGLHLR
jgi:hypothetical protein